MSESNLKSKIELDPVESAVSTQQYAVFSEPLQIAEDVSCCLKVNAVIAKEGIYDFPAGPNGETRRCLWSRPELLKATRTARAAKITIKDHPPGKVVTSQDEIYGTVEKPFFDRDRIRATLSFDKDITPIDFLEGIRAAAAKEGAPKDVSIGFYYSEDPVPGEWHGQHYDLAMRNIVIDHVATGVWRGRCSYPNCGIGVSSVAMAAFMNSRVPQNKINENENKNENIGGKKQVSEITENQPELDEHGCKIGVEKWSETDQKCVALEAPAEPAGAAEGDVDEHGCKVGVEKWSESENKCVPLETEPAASLETAALIEKSQMLLQLKAKRDEQNRIDQLRSFRRNPLSH